MKHNYSSFLRFFWLQKKALLFLLFLFLEINGALVSHPEQQIPQFQNPGDALRFQDALKTVIFYFDATANNLLDELTHTLSLAKQYKKMIAQKKIISEEHINMSKAYQIFFLPEALQDYFNNKESPYQKQLIPFIQAKDALIKILSYTSHSIKLQKTFLQFNTLTNYLLKYRYKVPAAISIDQEIKNKKRLFKGRIIEIGLITAFKNKIFDFLSIVDFLSAEVSKTKFENSDYTILHLNNNQNVSSHFFDIQRQWNQSIQESSNRPSQINQIISACINLSNKFAELKQDPQQLLLPLHGKDFSSSALQTLELLKEQIAKFEDLDAPEIESKLKYLLPLLKKSNRPAVWQVSEFLITLLPNIIKRRFFSQNREFIQNDALRKLQKDENFTSVINIITEIVKTTGSIHPAIGFLVSAQKELFDNFLPKAIADGAFKTKNTVKETLFFLEKNLIKFKEQISLLSDGRKNKEAAQKVTPYDFGIIYNSIRKKQQNEFRRLFYQPQLPIKALFLLERKKIFFINNNGQNSIIDPDTYNDFVSSGNPVVQDYASFLALELQNINNKDYLSKARPFLNLLADKNQFDIFNVNGLETYKWLLFLACLKDIENLYTAKFDDSEEMLDIDRKNFEKWIINNFPGTQNLKTQIDTLIKTIREKITLQGNLRSGYKAIKTFLDDLEMDKAYFQQLLNDTEDSIIKRTINKFALYCIKVFSFIINDEKLFTFFGKFKYLNHLIIQKRYNEEVAPHIPFEQQLKDAVQAYEALNHAIEAINISLQEKQETRTQLKNFRRALKNEIDLFWDF